MNKHIYIVGGWVRDSLLMRPSTDNDYVAVGYTEKELLEKYTFKDIGCVLKKQGKDFPVFMSTLDGSEIALARIERSTGDGFMDFKVDTSNVTLEEDLSRRDLTINAMAVHETGKEGFIPVTDVIDPFNGQADIKEKTLRHVSDAFKDDPVRVLRLARLRSQLPGYWKVAPETKVLVYKMRDVLGSLQKDRVWKEVYKALKSDNTHVFFETLFELGVLDVVFPNIYNMTTLKEGSKYHMEASVFEHTMSMLKIANTASIETKLAILYHDILKPFTYREYGNGSGHDDMDLLPKYYDIHMPIAIKKKVTLMIGTHLDIFKLDKIDSLKVVDIYSRFNKLEDTFKDLLVLSNADNNGRITLGPRDNLDHKVLLNLYKALKEVDITPWIREKTDMGYPPKGHKIAEQFRRMKAKVVRDAKLENNLWSNK